MLTIEKLKNTGKYLQHSINIVKSNRNRFLLKLVKPQVQFVVKNVQEGENIETKSLMRILLWLASTGDNRKKKYSHAAQTDSNLLADDRNESAGTVWSTKEKEQ